MRPLNQLGLIRVPMNPHQRVPGMPHKRTALDAFNATQEGRYLHPTKGWRDVTLHRSLAAQLVAEIKEGITPFSMKAMRRALAGQ